MLRNFALQPFAGDPIPPLIEAAFSKQGPGGTQAVSWNAATVSADPDTNLIYAADALPGEIAAVHLSASGLQTAWKVNQTTTEFIAIIGPPGQRAIVGTDIPGAQIPDFNSEDEVVWRNAGTRCRDRALRPLAGDYVGDDGPAGLLRGHAVPRVGRSALQIGAGSCRISMRSDRSPTLAHFNCSHQRGGQLSCAPCRLQRDTRRRRGQQQRERPDVGGQRSADAATATPPMTSAPIRSQSGAKAELRIQACRFPMNGVPGATIGLGADRCENASRQRSHVVRRRYVLPNPARRRAAYGGSSAFSGAWAFAGSGCRALVQHLGHEIEQLAQRGDARDPPGGDVLDAADQVAWRSSAPVQVQDERAVRAQLEARGLLGTT